MPAPRGWGTLGAAAVGTLLLLLLSGARGQLLGQGGGEAAEAAVALEPPGEGRGPAPPCGGLIGRGSCELRQLRAQLREARLESPLFDGARWTEDFETGLLMAQELQAAGLPPAHLFVAGAHAEWAPAAAAEPPPGPGRQPPSDPEL